MNFVRLGLNSLCGIRRFNRPDLALLLAAVALIAPPGAALAVTRAQMLALPVIVETSPGHVQTFGPLRAFMAALKRAGHVCRLSDYEHGINVDCGDPKAPDVLIDFDYVPSRSPEWASVDSLRTKGINGGELPVAEREQFLSHFSQIFSKPALY
jgi:hypothetical protein